MNSKPLHVQAGLRHSGAAAEGAGEGCREGTATASCGCAGSATIAAGSGNQC